MMALEVDDMQRTIEYLETKGVLVNTGNRPINPFGL